jgi:hypothetical protein
MISGGRVIEEPCAGTDSYCLRVMVHRAVLAHPQFRALHKQQDIQTSAHIGTLRRQDGYDINTMLRYAARSQIR